MRTYGIPPKGNVGDLRRESFALTRLRPAQTVPKSCIPPVGCLIDALPNELLVQILVAVDAYDRDGTSPAPEAIARHRDNSSALTGSKKDVIVPARAKLQAMLVSKRWHAVCVTTPQLWDQLLFDMRKPQHLLESHMDQVCSRSGSLPLQVSITNISDYSRVEINQQAFYGEMLRYLIPIIDRTWYLALSFNMNHAFFSILRTWSTPLPSLRFLSVEMVWKKSHNTALQPHTVPCEIFQQLQQPTEVRLHNCTIAKPSQSYNTRFPITSLYINPLTQLRDSGFAFRGNDVEACRMLEVCKNLSTLHIHTMYYLILRHDMKGFGVHPCLRTLTLTGRAWLLPLLSQPPNGAMSIGDDVAIVPCFPSLESFTLLLNDEGIAAVPRYFSLSKALGVHAPALRAFKIGHMHAVRRHVENAAIFDPYCLAWFKSPLETLELVHLKIDSYLDALVPRGDECVLADLKDLILRRCRGTDRRLLDELKRQRRDMKLDITTLNCIWGVLDSR